jgi:rhodanese-related sulfurtransferase
MKHAHLESLALSVLPSTILAVLLLALAGCGTSSKNPEDAAVVPLDTRPNVDVVTSSGAPDASDVGTDPVATDLASLRADAFAADTVPVLADADVRDTAPVRTDTTAMETAPVRSDVPGPEAAVIRADAVVLEVEPLRADTTTLDTASPRSDTSVPEVGASGADTGISSCNLDSGPATFVHMTPLELKTLLDGSENPFLINVKGASIGQIPGTDAVLVNDIPGIETLVGGDLCANIILYCQSGGTTQSVGTQLIAKGYLHVRDLAGGITAWKAAGYPTE